MRKLLVFFLVFILLLASSCADMRNADGVNIAVSFYPVYIFTMNLLDGLEAYTLSSITDASDGCLHDYQLTTSDLRLLADADLFIINGAGMEGFIEKAVSEVDGLNIADSSQGVSLIEGACEADGHDENSHDHEHEYDSHIWMSVSNAIIQVENIYSALMPLFPEQTEKLSANKDAYLTSLLALHEEIKASLTGLDAPVLTFHTAYAYFAKEYDINILDCIEAEEGEAPSAGELAALSELIKENAVKALFVEPEYSGSAADILAAETGAAVYILNPVTGGDNIKSAYEDIMRGNVSTLVSALKGKG